MASRDEAAAEKDSYHQTVFFSAALQRDLWSGICTVCCVSYIAGATIRIKLSELEVFDKTKENKSKKKKKNNNNNNKKERKKKKTICDCASHRFCTLMMVLVHTGGQDSFSVNQGQQVSVYKGYIYLSVEM